MVEDKVIIAIEIRGPDVGYSPLVDVWTPRPPPTKATRMLELSLPITRVSLLKVIPVDGPYDVLTRYCQIMGEITKDIATNCPGVVY